MIRIFLVVFALSIIGCDQPSNPSGKVASNETAIHDDTLSNPDSIAVVSQPHKMNVVRRAFEKKPAQSKPLNLAESADVEKQIVVFFPTQQEVQYYMDDESDDTGLIILEQFEAESVKFINDMGMFGCNVSTVEMSDVYMLLADKSIFKLERNSEETVCGVILYQQGKSPKALSGRLKSDQYTKEAKMYFGIK